MTQEPLSISPLTSRVHLYLKIDGSVHSVPLSDVLHVPNWNEACLISSTKLEMLGRFRVVAEDGIITVQGKSDHTYIVIAESMHGCYQVRLLI